MVENTEFIAISIFFFVSKFVIVLYRRLVRNAG